MLRTISFGAGVQSSTMAEMASTPFGQTLWGEPPDYAIFADTQSEPESVYRWLDFIRPRLAMPLIVVTAGNLAVDGLQVIKSGRSEHTYQKNLIPLFMLGSDGKKGILVRKCTSEYKVRQIIKKQRELVGPENIRAWRQQFREELATWRAYELALKAWKKLDKAQRAATALPSFPAREWEAMQAGALVETWIGFSTDEADRQKPSREPWIRNRFPLLEAGFSREDCLRWMSQRGLTPPRSACYFCPYHSDDEWIRLRDEEPEEFAKAVAWERACQEANRRDTVARGVPYLHSTRVPLDEVIFKPGDIDRMGQACGADCGT